jgi:methylenetetrahydrofolate dehydrogenase (NAD+)
MHRDKSYNYPAMADDKPNCKVILANNIAKSLLEEVRDGLNTIQRKPLLVGFLSSADPAARVYAEWTGKTCIEK